MLELNHKKLDVWKRSMDLVVEVYKLTAQLPDEERYGLVSQARRAAVSIPSNIAEGASRRSGKERSRFYEISRSSLVEMDTHFEIAQRLGYCAPEDLELLSEEANAAFAMLSRLMDAAA